MINLFIVAGVKHLMVLPRTLQELQQSGLWRYPYYTNTNRKKSPSPGDFDTIPTLKIMRIMIIMI